jgi:putative DNA primase/helicase
MIATATTLERVDPLTEAYEAEAKIRPLTDMGNAERVAARSKGRLLYVHGLGWLAWDGRRWARAERGEEVQAMKDTVRSIYAEAAEVVLDDTRGKVGAWAKQSEHAGRIEAAIRLARAEPALRAAVEDLDGDPYLLNVQNGILDLRTRELTEHDPKAQLTRITNASYDREAKSPRFEKFLERVLPDAEVRVYVQKIAGAALVGRHSEFLPFPYGSGRNGKTVLTQALARVLGDYAADAPPEMLARKRERGAREDAQVASLRGVRLVLAPETEGGSQLAEVFVKQLTGESRLKGKLMHKDYFEFENQATIIMSGNHKPRVAGQDEAIWERIKLIPFTVLIPEDERDPDLVDKLYEERDGILAWAVEGLALKEREGLQTPEAVRLASEGYREEQDRTRSWIDDRFERDPEGFTSNAVLRRSYEDYAKREGGFAPLGADRLRDDLIRLEFKPGRKKIGGRDGTTYRGFAGLRPTAAELNRLAEEVVPVDLGGVDPRPGGLEV